ncbi:MAG TPA: lysyl oxidase family protein [Miltoncostaeaceae bacterium]|nr:lysyl oxidase family protein [Miltoncostaeaceae bacterium]
MEYSREAMHIRRRPSRRHSVLVMLASAGVAAGILPLLASAGPGTRAPDLRADPVEGVEGPQVYADTGIYGAGRLLVRFDGFVTNVGDGPLEVSGNPQTGSVRQRAWSSSQGPGDAPSVEVGTPEVLYEEADGHDHFHLRNAMRYSLWNLQRTAQVAPGQKAGFCLYDIEDAPSPAPPQDPQVYSEAVTHFCEQGDPRSTSLRMGTSSGWRDVYGKYLAYQWVDVSSTAPGTYLVGSEADPENRIWEGGGAAEVNPPAFASQPVTVPGWTALPVTASQSASPQTVTLAAQKFGTQADGNLRYRILSTPAGGSLNVPVGGSFNPASQSLVYTPTPGYGASDAFTFAAYSASSPFPTSPPVSTVTIVGATPSVAISGMPLQVVAGSSVQLRATVANLPGGVTWSATAGTISSTGLYLAPKTPPTGGVVTVTATSTANPGVAGTAATGIRPSPDGAAAPGIAGRAVAGGKALSRIRTGHVGRKVILAKVQVGGRRGTLKFTATAGPRVVGRCAIGRVGARRTVTCKITMKRPYPLKKVRFTARFTSVTGAVAVRRAWVVR